MPNQTPNLVELQLVLGQAPAPAPAPAPGVTASRSYYFDIALVVLLFGAALFAICRSSRRT
ncbi:MAG: hypothetical protein CMJ78_24990 [Planctomycetaceae bacterium]|nr:hypothetical protein [Planctomycetaceae bacterium]